MSWSLVAAVSTPPNLKPDLRTIVGTLSGMPVSSTTMQGGDLSVLTAYSKINTSFPPVAVYKTYLLCNACRQKLQNVCDRQMDMVPNMSIGGPRCGYVELNPDVNKISLGKGKRTAGDGAPVGKTPANLKFIHHTPISGHGGCPSVRIIHFGQNTGSRTSGFYLSQLLFNTWISFTTIDNSNLCKDPAL